MTIRLHKLTSPGQEGVDIECASVKDAVKELDRDHDYVIVRFEGDDDWVWFDKAVAERNSRARDAVGLTVIRDGQLPTARLWVLHNSFSDGAGWRSVFMAQIVAVQPPPVRPH